MQMTLSARMTNTSGLADSDEKMGSCGNFLPSNIRRALTNHHESLQKKAA
jgi:hypothetical protein